MTTHRNGTYVAFHAAGTSDPTASDIKYYNLLKAWHVREENDFEFVNSHDKTSSVRDTSSKETLRASLIYRLRRSKNMILILGETTRFDTDWVPFEIAYAIDECSIPIVAAYPGYTKIQSPQQYRAFWPGALATRIDSGKAHVIHMPFRKEPLIDSMRFDHNNYPVGGGLGYYNDDAYRTWGG
jgi:hypothetical protein